MENEIEAFLRKIAEQSLGGPLSDEDDDEIIDAVLIDESEPEEPIVAEAVGPRSTSRLVDRAAPLSESVDQADERMDEHLQEVFDHRLGQLGRDSQEPAQQPERKVARLKLFRSRDAIRNAIILNEIINRPEQRW